jgi:hypothetical protein
MYEIKCALLLVNKNECRSDSRGSVTLIKDFFIIHIPPGHLEFLRKFAEISESKGLLPMSTTRAINENLLNAVGLVFTLI